MKKIYLLFCIFIIVKTSAQNPLLLNNVISNTSSNHIAEIAPTSSGITFFSTQANDVNDYSDLWGLWRTDGSITGTRKLTLTATGFISKKATMLNAFGANKIIFAGDNLEGYGEIWVSDGTQAGTFVIQNFLTTTANGTVVPVQGIVSPGDFALYGAISNDAHLKLYRTSGAGFGDTIVVHDFGETSGANQLAQFKSNNGIAYFDFYNVDGGGNDEIWRSDGTVAGTFQLKDFGSSGFLMSYFMPAGNTVYFMTGTYAPSAVLYKTDGTVAGTVPVKTINASTYSTNTNPSFAAVGSTLYFAADDGVNGKELWKTDGSDAGTFMVADIDPGGGNAEPYWLCALNNQVLFSARDGNNDLELWKYDGVSASRVKDIYPGSNSSYPYDIVATKNAVVFAAQKDYTDGFELWTSDGTAANTVEIADINNLIGGSNPQLITAGDTVYFAAGQDVNRDGLVKESSIYAYKAPGKIWTGSVSNDISDANNWAPYGVPQNTDDVVVPPYPQNSCNIGTNLLFCNSLYNNGSNVNISGGLVFLNGDLYNAGIINNYSNGVFAMVSLSSGSLRSLGGTGTFNGQLTFSSQVNVRLTSNFKVNTFLVEGADSVYLGDYDFTVDSIGLYQPKIITDGYGRYIQPVRSNAVLFPVCATAQSYTPVTMTNYGTPDYFAVNVRDGVYSGGYAGSGNVITQEAVNKTWTIDEQTYGGSNANITLQWNAADELTMFNRSNVYLSHYIGGAWDNGNATVASGSNPYQVIRTGITSFSPFAIASSDIILPLRLSDFAGVLHNSDVLLSWHTSTETNTAYFNVQRSTDGIHFTAIAKINAHGNSAAVLTYDYTDANVAALKQQHIYYRLQQVDKDGSYTYSKTISVAVNQNNIQFSFSPNPVHNSVHISFNNQNSKQLIIHITDASGKVVYQQQPAVATGIFNTDIDLGNLRSGMYILEIITDGGITSSKFIKQ